jgi:thiol-disulfide isomerase/thioredoxin
MRSLIPFLLLFIASCAIRPNVHEIPLTDLTDSEAIIDPEENVLTIIYFLSPECPLCINYTLALRNLEEDFASDSILFYGVFSKAWFSPEEVDSFATKYDLPFKMLLDDGNQLARALGATITPEVFVLNAESEVIYSGKIDNWVNDLGKKKLEVSEHYLENALIAWRDGKPIGTKRTEPKGCLIE